MAKYTVTLNRDVETYIGHLVVMSDTATTTIDSAPTTTIQRAGARQFSTRKAALAFQAAQRASHGHDVCGEVVQL